MKGRKAALPDNVAAIPVEFQGRPDEWYQERSDDLRPSDLKDSEREIWDRVAPQLCRVGRLKALFVDVIAEYCRITACLVEARKMLDEEQWIYVTTGRHGEQRKANPRLAQLNDDWRKWRSLVGELGLSPNTDRNLNSAQGDLFDDEFGQI